MCTLPSRPAVPSLIVRPLLLLLLLLASSGTPSALRTVHDDRSSATSGIGVTRLAAIGDFGADAAGGAGREAQAAAIIAQLDTQRRLHGILALGDTNYPLGAAATIDQNVGKYFGQYMWPLRSNYSRGAKDRTNRFFPCPGNHDWYGPGVLGPYLDYMPVGGRRYFDVLLGHVHVFSLDSDPRENALDGTSSTSKQAQWLRSALSNSSAPWKLVIAHFPPYSSGSHGSSSWMQWPFEEWGVAAVLSGHDHTYERLVPGPSGMPYYVNGLGGASSYSFPRPLSISAARFTGTPGVQLIHADARRMQLSFLPAPPPNTPLNMTGMDCYEIVRAASGAKTYGPCSPWDLGAVEQPPGGGSADGGGGGAAACLAAGQSCLAPAACCAPLVCHTPEARCGASRASDFQWMRRRRGRRQRRHQSRSKSAV